MFDSVLNTGANAADVPYVLKLRSVPYRFITDFDIETNLTSFTFGVGDAQTFDGDLIPDLGDLSLPVFGKETFTDFSLDPQNFLQTRTLGLAPVNTVLTVQYRVGGGADTAAGSGDINSVSEKVFEVSDTSLSSAIVRDVANSFSVVNPGPIIGGRDTLDLEELKQLIPAIFSSQSRMVGIEDFIVRALSMPAKFGSVFRANAKPSGINKNSVELYVLSRDVNGFVVRASQELKENLKKYLSRFRMLTDAIELMDGEIIDIGLNFNILTFPDFNKTEVLAACIEELKNYFKTDYQQINQPINLSDVYVLLKNVPGVLSLIDFNVVNKVGIIDNRIYSNTGHNIAANTKNGIIYSGENKFFQLKYPSIDLRGTAR